MEMTPMPEELRDKKAPPKGKEWREVEFESCPECGGTPEALVRKDCPKDWWEDGEDVRCTCCGFDLGSMSADEYCVGINWLDDPDETMDWYRKRYAAMAERERKLVDALKNIERACDDTDATGTELCVMEWARKALEELEK